MPMRYFFAHRGSVGSVVLEKKEHPAVHNNKNEKRTKKYLNLFWAIRGQSIGYRSLMENNDNNSIIGIRNMGNKLSFVLSFVKIKRLKTNNPNVPRA